MPFSKILLQKREIFYRDYYGTVYKHIICTTITFLLLWKFSSIKLWNNIGIVFRYKYNSTTCYSFVFKREIILNEKSNFGESAKCNKENWDMENPALNYIAQMKISPSILNSEFRKYCTVPVQHKFLILLQKTFGLAS